MAVIRIDLSQQTLTLRAAGVPRVYPVSTGANGPGECHGSGCTPRGRHRVRLKIGAGCPAGAVFRGRRWTGEVYSRELGAAQPQRDWILTRILWLTGTEPGRNRGGAVDSLRRFIYIHGCPPTEPMGVPRSHGCIRMRDADLIALFDAVPLGSVVDIH
ncbi:MAG: L,D-transpeptidase family protein [Gammaproteobacteria bacterium]|jgi:hypothetical protein|nr:L,D-transpeptidase family protein [Gammaproteobacteria bacterium]